jgi:hypothetical protein
MPPAAALRTLPDVANREDVGVTDIFLPEVPHALFALLQMPVGKMFLGEAGRAV